MPNQSLYKAVRGPGRSGSCVLVATLCLTLSAGPTLAQEAAAPSADVVFQDQAAKLGAQQCAGLYAALGQGVTRGAAFAVRTETRKDSPDAHMVQGVVGLTYDLPELKGQAGGVVVATPTADGCEGQLVRIVPFQQPCDQIVSLLPAGAVEEPTLSGVRQYQLGEQGQALMIPNGATCVVVSLGGMTQGR